MKIIKLIPIDPDLLEQFPIEYGQIVMGREKVQSVKRNQIGEYLRREKFSKTSCYICNNQFGVEECHHVITIEDITDIILRNEENGGILPGVHLVAVYLCPTHHKILHSLDAILYERITKYGLVDYMKQVDPNTIPEVDLMDQPEQERMVFLYGLKLLTKQILHERFQISKEHDVWRYLHIIDAGVFGREGVDQGFDNHIQFRTLRLSPNIRAKSQPSDWDE